MLLWEELKVPSTISRQAWLCINFVTNMISWVKTDAFAFLVISHMSYAPSIV
jgi:hypothetical protein